MLYTYKDKISIGCHHMLRLKDYNMYYHEDQKSPWNMPINISQMIKISSEKIIDISCGFKHSIAILENRMVVSWGWNHYG